jgi:predicted Zn-dependent protease
MRALFDRLADALEAQARPGEWLAATLDAEGSEFLRLNGARVRQAGRVERAVAQLRLVDGGRQAFHSLTLPGLHGDADAVSRAVHEALGPLRAAIVDSAPDPLLDFHREVLVSDDGAPDEAFDREAFVDTVAAAAGALDLVGFCAAGPVARGFCSSAGSRQWYQRSSVVFDWSIHLPVDEAAGGARKAVKAGWAAPRFDAVALAAAIARSGADAAVMARPVRRLVPGERRVLLAPRAFADLLELLGWGGFSARAHRAGQSPLARLQRGEARLSPLLSMAEDLDTGFAPGFQSEGYLRPRRVPLIDAGCFSQWLVSPRTAREFGLPSNAAGSSESPESLRVAPGSLAEADALGRLGTGLSIANLWYLNFSDRPAGRVTGMTRFACVWVEDGEPVAPVEAMRFDDSVYRMLGDALEALGDTPRAMPATDTYASRATGGIEAPAALLAAMRFTL